MGKYSERENTFDGGLEGSKTLPAEIKKDVKRFRLTQNNRLLVESYNITITANIGDYIIKDVTGEFIICKPYDFHKTYEPMENNQ